MEEETLSPFFCLDSRRKASGLSLSPLSLFLYLLTSVSTLTWNVASRLTNAGSPLRLPRTSFSESR